MSERTKSGLSRRDLMKSTGKVAVASALAGMAVPHVHAAESNTIRVVLVGCGGRGTGAAGNALASKQGPVQLVAMSDVFEDRLSASLKRLERAHAKQVDVPKDRQFVGFDGYKKAIDCLRPGDVAIFATPPAFRWVHFGYAIQKGVNVFMEKPITVDGPSTVKMLKLAEQAEQKDLKVGVGLMCRHCDARQQLHDRIKNGEIGDIILMRAYRAVGPTGSAFSLPKPDDTSELLWQIKRFHSFLWLSGGAFSDFLIHNIDECCWMKDAWPVSAKGFGGRHYRKHYVDQNFDSYTVEYTFADGTKMMLEGRNMNGCHQEFASYAHGSKGSAVISTSAHSPARCRIYKSQNMVNADLAWKAPSPEPDPYQLEWEHLMRAIREDQPYNEVRRGAEASLITSMGRMACHTGRIITRDQMLDCDHEFAPDVNKLAMNSPAPLQCDTDGQYALPQPGIKIKREY